MMPSLGPAQTPIEPLGHAAGHGVQGQQGSPEGHRLTLQRLQQLAGQAPAPRCAMDHELGHLRAMGLVGWRRKPEEEAVPRTTPSTSATSSTISPGRDGEKLAPPERLRRVVVERWHEAHRGAALDEPSIDSPVGCAMTAPRGSS